MRIGVPKEIKIHEYRVGLTPDAAARLAREGHDVLVETGAGVGAGFDDAQYASAGATIMADADAVFRAAEMIVKVKEPQLEECAKLSPGQILFTYLHLAADPGQARALMRSGATAIAYETVTDARGTLPLLKPMSCIAGRMAAQVGARHLEMPSGRGMLLGGVPGVAAARVVVVGAGVAGTNALEMAVGLQANVTVLDIDLARLEELATRFGNRIRTLYSTPEAIAREVRGADLVIGSVLIPGASAPKLVSREMVQSMRPGSVLVDIAIDQGGCFETSRPTCHADPRVHRERHRPLCRDQHARRRAPNRDAGADQRHVAPCSLAGAFGMAPGRSARPAPAQRNQCQRGGDQASRRGRGARRKRRTRLRN